MLLLGCMLLNHYFSGVKFDKHGAVCLQLFHRDG